MLWRSLAKNVFTISPLFFHLVQDCGSALDSNPSMLGNDVDQLGVDLLSHADSPTNIDPALMENDLLKDLLTILVNLILYILLWLALHP